MTQPIENLIQQMSLKHPSDELDRRIAELIVEHRLEIANAVRQGGRFRWARWLTTAASFLAIGTILGFLIARDGPWQTAEQERRAEANPELIRVIGNSGSMEATVPTNQESESNASLDADNREIPTNDSATELSEARTRIVTEGLVRTEDGELKRAYRTVTPKRLLIFDPETNAFFDVEIEIPRVVMTNRPEI